MSARTERLFPLLAGLLASIGAGIVAFACGIEPLPPSLAAGTMTFGVVVAGFAATQRSMLLGMHGSEVLRFAVRTGYYRDVLDYLMHCVYAGLFISVASVAGFFLGDNAMLWCWWLAVLTGGIVLALALMLRNELLIRRIIERFLEDSNLTSGDNRRESVRRAGGSKAGVGGDGG